MKENNELTRDDIAIDHDMEVDCDEGREIAVYIETWFDVDKKFHIDTASDDDTWLNMYGRYNPFDDTLRIECEISRQDSSSYFDYEPTKDEAQGFEVRRMRKADIKRFLALYFEASINGEQMPDIDGEQFYEVDDDEEDEDAFNEAVQRIIQNAYYTNGDAPVYGDRLLTLSTCYGSTRSSRLIIIAKEENANVWKTESADAGTDGGNSDEGLLRYDFARFREILVRPLCCWRQLPICVGYPRISPLH